jgi:hypothetical protein
VYEIEQFEATAILVFSGKSKGNPMAIIPNPKASLQAIGAYLRNIGELLIDAECDARDAGLADVQAQIVTLQTSVTTVRNDVRARLAQMNGGCQ